MIVYLFIRKKARLPKVGTVPIKQAPPAKVEKIDLEAEAIAKVCDQVIHVVYKKSYKLKNVTFIEVYENYDYRQLIFKYIVLL